jgi:hypothetical protein
LMKLARKKTLLITTLKQRNSLALLLMTLMRWKQALIYSHYRSLSEQVQTISSFTPVLFSKIPSAVQITTTPLWWSAVASKPVLSTGSWKTHGVLRGRERLQAPLDHPRRWQLRHLNKAFLP